MDLIFIILLAVDALLLVALLVVGFTKKKVAEPVEETKEEVKEEAQEEPVEETQEEVKEEPVEETQEETAVTEEEQEDEEAEEVEEESDEEDDSDDFAIASIDENGSKKRKPTVPFARKMLDSEEKIQNFYNELRNKFKSYRGINARVSKRCDTIRDGKELIAKMLIRGKTFKLYLALDPNAYDENKFHQKYEGDKKAYEEVPMVVKIRSDRAFKNAEFLIEELMDARNVEAKARYEAKDFIEELKEKV